MVVMRALLVLATSLACALVVVAWLLWTGRRDRQAAEATVEATHELVGLLIVADRPLVEWPAWEATLADLADDDALAALADGRWAS